MRLIRPLEYDRRARLLTLVGAGLCAVLASCSSSPPAGTPIPPLPTPSSSAVPQTSSASQNEKFTLVATGDVLLHDALWPQARKDAKRTGHGVMDFKPMMEGVEPYVSKADVGLCHLETPLAKLGGPYYGYPSFSAPPQVADSLHRVGFDVCSTVSNHTFDQGVAGVERTLDALDAAGVKHAGSARTQKESRKITTLRVNGVKVAFLAYTYGFNGSSAPAGQPWRANVIDQDKILDDATRARRNGAEVVVASLHWGTEYQQSANPQQAELAPVLAKSGKLDLIISHHAHVVEPIQKIGRTWVVYGLGNMIANHETAGDPNAEGLLTRFTFERKPGARRFHVSKAEYVPLLMTKTAPRRVLDVRKALSSKEYGSATRARLLQALRRTTTVVDSLGAAKDGLVPAPFE